MAENVISIFLRARENATRVFKTVRKEVAGVESSLSKLSKVQTRDLETGFRKFRIAARDLGIDIRGVNKEFFQLNRVRLEAAVQSVRRLQREARIAAERLSDIRDRARAVNEQSRQVLRQSIVPVAFGAASVRSAGIFSGQLAEISTLVDSAVTSNEELRASVIGLSNEFGRNRGQVAAGLYSAISAGAEQGTESVNFLEVALRQSIGGVTDVQTSVKGLSSIINAFNLEFSDAEEVSDALFQTMKGGQTTISELSRFIFQAAPTANVLNASYKDLLATTQALSLGGTPTSVAFTQIRAAMVGLLRETPELSKVLEDLNVENFKGLVEREGLPGAFQAISDAVGGSESAIIKLTGSIEGANAIFGVTGDNVDKVTKALADQANAAGAAQAAQEKVSQELGAVINRLTNSISNLFEEIGNGIGEALKPFFISLTEVITGLSDFIRINRESLEPLVKVAAAVLTFRIALASLTLVVSGIIPGFAAARLAMANFSAASATGVVAAGRFSTALVGLRTVALTALGPIGWLVLLGTGIATMLNIMEDRGPNVLKGFQEELDRLQANINTFSTEDIPIEITRIENQLTSLQLKITETQAKLESFGQGPRGGRFASRDRVISENEALLEGLIDQETEFLEQRSKLKGRIQAQDELQEAREAEKRIAAEARIEAARTAALAAAQKDRAGLQKAENDLRIAELTRVQAVERQLNEQVLRDAEALYERDRGSNVAALENLFNTRRQVLEENYARERALQQAQFRAQQQINRAAIEQAATEVEKETARVQGDVALERLGQQVQIVNERQRQALAELDTQLNEQRFTEITRSFNELTSAQTQQLENLNNLRENGGIAARDAEQQALDIQNRTNEGLTQLIAQTKAYLELFPNDQRAVQTLAELEAAVTRVKTSSSELTNELRDAFEQSFTQLFVDLAEGAKSTEEVFKDLANSVIDQLIRIAAQRAALGLATSLFGPATPISTGGAVSTNSRGGFQAFARGGPVGHAKGAISGPGTGTSDSIAALLSHGEYVVKAKAVKHYGANVLEHINRMQLPMPKTARSIPITRPRVRRFMDGGQVAGLPNTDGTRTATSQIQNFNSPIQVVTPDVAGFNRSERQIQAAQQRSLRKNGRRLG